MAGVDFQIGAAPRSVGRSVPQSTPNLGSALAKLGQSWALAYSKKQAAEAKQTAQEAQTVKRGQWAQALGQGATLRDIAASDPSILSDSGFVSFWDKTRKPKGYEDILDDQGRPIAQRGPQGRTFAHPLAPSAEAPEPERFEDVDSPFGRGGVGQRSSASNKLINYHGAATPAAPLARQTAKDRHGRLRFLDDGSPAFSDAVLGDGPPPATPEGPPLKDRLTMARQLSSDWRETTRPMQTLLDQSDRMAIGFKMAQAGQLLAGSQAILISFNKLLDPTSVVRESEYARSASGQSALETLRGYAEKLSAGGAGVTLRELQSYKEFGEKVVQRALESTVGPERARISRLVAYAGIDPKLVFSGRFAPEAAPQGPPQAAPQVMSQVAPQGAPRSIAPLARALAGGRPAPSAAAPVAAALGAPPAPQGTAPSEMSAGDRHRIEMYARLPEDALQRQAEDMRDNPTAYSTAEKRAAGLAWRRIFEGR